MNGIALGRRAARHEFAVHWAARPAVAVLLRAGRLAGPRFGGVLRVPRLGWLITDPVLSRTLLNDYAHTSVLGEGGVGHLWEQLLGPWVNDVFDGAGHHDLRTRARGLFTETSSAELVADAVGATCSAAVATLRAGGELDVARLTRVMVGRTVVRLLGLPAPQPRSDGAPDDEPYLAAFADAEALAALALGTAASTELRPQTVAAGRAIVDRLTAGVEHGWRAGDPQTLLGRCRELGLGLDETRGLATLIVVAGTGTTASALTRTIALLADHGLTQRLALEPEKVPDAVREGLRVTTSAPLIGRHVTADTTLGGKRFRAGERVLVLAWSANTAIGPFDLDRPYVPETRQLWFGAGRHLCLGAPVARAEMAHLIGALAGAGSGWRVVHRRAAPKVLVPTYDELVIRLL